MYIINSIFKLINETETQLGGDCGRAVMKLSNYISYIFPFFSLRQRPLRRGLRGAAYSLCAAFVPDHVQLQSWTWHVTVWPLLQQALICGKKRKVVVLKEPTQHSETCFIITTLMDLCFVATLQSV